MKLTNAAFSIIIIALNSFVMNSCLLLFLTKLSKFKAEEVSTYHKENKPVLQKPHDMPVLFLLYSAFKTV